MLSALKAGRHTDRSCNLKVTKQPQPRTYLLKLEAEEQEVLDQHAADQGMPVEDTIGQQFKGFFNALRGKIDSILLNKLLDGVRRADFGKKKAVAQLLGI